jgi:signal transduction histidine kinase
MILSKSHVLVVFIAGTILFLIFVFFLVTYLLIHNRKQQKNRLEKQKMIFEHNQALLEAHLEEQENTLNEISKDIHDNVIQKLSFAQMNMHVLNDELGNDNRMIATRISELLSQVSNDLHNISHLSNTDYIKTNGLVEVLRKEIEYIESGRKMHCNFTVDGNPAQLDPEKALLVYRIAQEAVHNAIKHSKATVLDIDLQYKADGLCITISDNGIGFNLNQMENVKGIGLSNMSHRANLLNTEINIESVINGGCAVSLDFSY